MEKVQKSFERIASCHDRVIIMAKCTHVYTVSSSCRLDRSYVIKLFNTVQWCTLSRLTASSSTYKSILFAWKWSHLLSLYLTPIQTRLHARRKPKSCTGIKFCNNPHWILVFSPFPRFRLAEEKCSNAPKMEVRWRRLFILEWKYYSVVDLVHLAADRRWTQV